MVQSAGRKLLQEIRPDPGALEDCFEVLSSIRAKGRVFLRSETIGAVHINYKRENEQKYGK
jgi:hypothetical protein